MHDDHWMEPKSVTDKRPVEERFCESCGESLPYHNVSCGMLKNAHKTRKRKCDYCLKVLVVGDEMYEHMVANHVAELRQRGIQLP